MLLLMLLLLFFVPAPVGGHRSTPKEKRDGRKETLAKGERHTHRQIQRHRQTENSEGEIEEKGHRQTS